MGGLSGGEPRVNNRAVLSPDSHKRRLLQSRRKALVGMVPVPTDGMLQ